MPEPISAGRNVLADSNANARGVNPPAIPKKLLVIDDEVGICTVIARVATTLGLGTRVVCEPSDAVQAFIDFAPDLVLLDMIMPGKDGVDLLHEMLLTGVPAKFILMSGYGETFMRLAQGVAVFHGTESPATLSKPFRREALVALLRTSLSLDAGTSPYGQWA
jgi:two-component system response regulator MtrA